MFLYCLNKSFVPIALVSSYEALIWDERMQTAGEFLLVLKVSDPVVQYLQRDYYLTKDNIFEESFNIHLMVIESFEYPSDDDTIIKIRGRCLKSLLDRRYILEEDPFADLRTDGDNTKFSLSSAVQAVLNATFIELENDSSLRKVGIFNESISTDAKVDSVIEAFGTNHDNVYEWLTKICKTYNLGFDLTLGIGPYLNFKIYGLIDKSSQLVFAKEYGNLTEDSYIESGEKYKNTLICLDESKLLKEFQKASASGLDRKEYYAAIDDEYLSDANKFEQKAKLELSSHIVEAAIAGKIVANNYIYGETYKLGDIVLVVSHGRAAVKAFISEYIYSYENGEITEYPAFTYMLETAGRVVSPEDKPVPPQPVLTTLQAPLAVRTTGLKYLITVTDWHSENIKLFINGINYYRQGVAQDTSPTALNDGQHIWNISDTYTWPLDWSALPFKVYQGAENCVISFTYYNPEYQTYIPVTDVPVRYIAVKAALSPGSTPIYHEGNNFIIAYGTTDLAYISFTFQGALGIYLPDATYTGFTPESIRVRIKVSDTPDTGYSVIDQNLIDFMLKIGDITPKKTFEIDLNNFIGPPPKPVPSKQDIVSAAVSAYANGYNESAQTALTPISYWEYPVKDGYMLTITQVKETKHEGEVLILK